MIGWWSGHPNGGGLYWMPGSSLQNFITATHTAADETAVILPNGGGYTTIATIRLVFALVRAGILAEPGGPITPTYLVG